MPWREKAFSRGAKESSAGASLAGKSATGQILCQLSSVVPHGIEVEEFTVDAAEDADMDLVSYGLDVPALRIQLTDDLGEKVEIRVGEVDGTPYLMRTGVASVYRIGTDLLEDLKLGLGDVSKAPVASAADDTTAD